MINGILIAAALVGSFDYTLSGGVLEEKNSRILGNNIVASDGETLSFVSGELIEPNVYTSGGNLSLSGGFTSSMGAVTILDLGNNSYRILGSGISNPDGIGGLSILYHISGDGPSIDSGNLAFNSSVPEPSSIILIGVGLSGMVLYRRIRG